MKKVCYTELCVLFDLTEFFSKKSLFLYIFQTKEVLILDNENLLITCYLFVFIEQIICI